MQWNAARNRIKTLSATIRRGVARTLGDEGGFVLVVVLVAIAVGLVLVTSMGSLASTDARATHYMNDRNQAFYVAESGLNHTLWKLKYDGGSLPWPQPEPGGPQGLPYNPDGDVSFTSDTEESFIDLDGDEVAETHILADGTSYRVWVLKDAENTKLHYIAVEAHARDQSFVLKATAEQTNGPSEDDENGNGGNETPTATLAEPDIPCEPGLHLAGGSGSEWKTYYLEQVLGPGTHYIEYLEITGQAIVYVPDNYTLWVRDHITFNGGAQVNWVELPLLPAERFVIYMPSLTAIDQNVSISGGAQFTGFIYAPTTRIHQHNNTNVVGCLTGEDVRIDPHAVCTYTPDYNMGFAPEARVDFVVKSYGW